MEWILPIKAFMFFIKHLNLLFAKDFGVDNLQTKALSLSPSFSPCVAYSSEIRQIAFLRLLFHTLKPPTTIWSLWHGCLQRSAPVLWPVRFSSASCLSGWREQQPLAAILIQCMRAHSTRYGYERQSNGAPRSKIRGGFEPWQGRRRELFVCADPVEWYTCSLMQKTHDSESEAV